MNVVRSGPFRVSVSNWWICLACPVLRGLLDLISLAYLALMWAGRYWVRGNKLAWMSSFSCASPLRRAAARPKEEIKECSTNVQQVFLLYLWGSLVTLELISLIPLVGSLEENPLAVKLLNNRLYIPIHKFWDTRYKGVVN